MNIYDIAEKCGVSIATVSRVLNNNPNVSAATRERILAVINEANYTPSALARNLGNGASTAATASDSAPLSAVGVLSKVSSSCLSSNSICNAVTMPTKTPPTRSAVLLAGARLLRTVIALCSSSSKYAILPLFWLKIGGVCGGKKDG